MTDEALTLAGTSDEFRKALTQFRSEPGHCSATDRRWGGGAICDELGTYLVVCEDAHAGVTSNGVFSPATVQTVVCVEHLDRVKSEPRRVFAVYERIDPGAPSASVAFIQQVPWD